MEYLLLLLKLILYCVFSGNWLPSKPSFFNLSNYIPVNERVTNANFSWSFSNGGWYLATYYWVDYKLDYWLNCNLLFTNMLYMFFKSIDLPCYYIIYWWFNQSESNILQSSQQRNLKKVNYKIIRCYNMYLLTIII